MSAATAQFSIDPVLTHGESFIVNQDDGTLINATWDGVRSVWMLHKLDFNKGTCESAELNFCSHRQLAGLVRSDTLVWR